MGLITFLSPFSWAWITSKSTPSLIIVLIEQTNNLMSIVVTTSPPLHASVQRQLALPNAVVRPSSPLQHSKFGIQIILDINKVWVHFDDVAVPAEHLNKTSPSQHIQMRLELMMPGSRGGGLFLSPGEPPPPRLPAVIIDVCARSHEPQHRQNLALFFRSAVVDRWRQHRKSGAA